MRATDRQSSCPQGQSEENKQDKPTSNHSDDKNNEDHQQRGEFKNWKGEDQRKGRGKVGGGPPGQEQEGPQLRGDPKSGQEWNEAHVGMKESTQQEKARIATQTGVGTSTAPAESLKSLKKRFMIHVPVVAVVREKGDGAPSMS